MAALTTSEVVKLITDGTQLRTVLYRVNGVSSGDTWDASTEFGKVVFALWYPVTGSSTAGQLPITTNTTVTLSSGCSVDSGWLTLIGGAP